MFEYRWLRSVLDKLADIYVSTDVPDRDRIVAGVEMFNLKLATDPLSIGESRGDGYRVAFLPLLLVYFHVDEANLRVQITDVSRYGR